MAEDGGLDQVEAMREDVRAQKGVHGVQLDEDVGQEHHLRIGRMWQKEEVERLKGGG